MLLYAIIVMAVIYFMGQIVKIMSNFSDLGATSEDRAVRRRLAALNEEIEEHVGLDPRWNK